MTDFNDPDSLFTKRLNTWIGRTRDEDKPFVFSHWTGHGTLSTEPSYPAGMRHCELLLDGRRITTVANPYHAVAMLMSGELDAELGFSAKEAGVPESLALWGRSESS